MRVVLSLLLFLSFGVALFGQVTPFRPFEPKLNLVLPDIDYESVYGRADITELLTRLPEIDPEIKDEVKFNPEVWAKRIRHERDVWCLQFSFKNVRIIDVDIPNAAGNFDKKKIWYLVYNVKNLGPADLEERKINSALGTEVQAERPLPVREDKTSLDLPREAPLEVRGQPGIFAPRPGKSESIRFVPHFILTSLIRETAPVTEPGTDKTQWQIESNPVSYHDSVIPLALLKIEQRERMKLATTVSITGKEIAPGEEVWGVAMWTDIDPRINEFSIFVSGLTNAYQWLAAEEGTFENTGQIGEGRIIRRKVLKTNWWRVGDAQSLNETQIHYGAREIEMSAGIFDKEGRLTSEERKILEEKIKDADANKDGWVSPAEKAIYHLIHQIWTKPTLYEWVFL
jgi:hypothetical protein